MIEPIGSRVVIEVDSSEEKEVNGLIVPIKKNEKPQEGVIISIGKGDRLPDGSNEVMDVQVGDTVFYEKFAGVEYVNGNKKYLIVHQRDILGIIKK